MVVVRPVVLVPFVPHLDAVEVPRFPQNGFLGRGEGRGGVGGGKEAHPGVEAEFEFFLEVSDVESDAGGEGHGVQVSGGWRRAFCRLGRRGRSWRG